MHRKQILSYIFFFFNNLLHSDVQYTAIHKKTSVATSFYCDFKHKETYTAYEKENIF